MNSNEIPLNYFYREYSQNYRKIVLERQVQLLKYFFLCNVFFEKKQKKRIVIHIPNKK